MFSVRSPPQSSIFNVRLNPMLDVCTADVPEGDSLPRDIHLFGLAMTTTPPPPPSTTTTIPSPTNAFEEEDPFAFGGGEGFDDVFSDVEAPVRGNFRFALLR